MSHSINAKINKQLKHPKVQTNQYLYNSNEPQDNYDFHFSSDLEFEMLENSASMKHRIRRHAQRMRKIQY